MSILTFATLDRMELKIRFNDLMKMAYLMQFIEMFIASFMVDVLLRHLQIAILHLSILSFFSVCINRTQIGKTEHFICIYGIVQ